MWQSSLVLPFYFIVMLLTMIWVYRNHKRIPAWYSITFVLFSFVYTGLMAVTVINHSWWWIVLGIVSFMWNPIQAQGYRWGQMWKDANAEGENQWAVLEPTKFDRYLLRFVYSNCSALIGFGFISFVGWLIDNYLI